MSGNLPQLAGRGGTGCSVSATRHSRPSVCRTVAESCVSATTVSTSRVSPI
ncbi:hypothetical protein [Lentzea indica]|uniref:hypothetical protein n=1 Tax=Lentzea indica TaxID=2604800 RepID=UPI001CB75099|nr:hypothetical protein [Lentzea indica]